MNWELSELDWISLCGNTRDIDEIYSRWYGYFRLIIGKYIPLETVTIRAKDKPWMDSKVRLSIRRRAACSEFTINAHLQARGNAIGLNVTLLPRSYDLPKKPFMKEPIRAWAILILTVKSGGQSLIGYVVWKIPHLSQPLLITKCLYLIPRKKRASLTTTLCPRLNLQAPTPFLMISRPIRHNDLYPVLSPQKSKCFNWWRALISLKHVVMMELATG